MQRAAVMRALGVRFSGLNLLKTFLPISGMHYWYLVTYFALLIASPLLNLLVAQLGRRHPVGEGGVHRRAEHEPGDHPPLGQAVEVRHLLRHPDRRVVEGERVADDEDGRVLGGAGALA